MTDILSGESLRERLVTVCPLASSRQNVGAPVCSRSLSERVHSARCWMTDILSGESLRERLVTVCPLSDSRQNVGAPVCRRSV